MGRKQAFTEEVAHNIMDLVDHTYHVSKQYATDEPTLSMAYDASHHRLDVTIDQDEINIPLKYNRLNRRVTAELFADVKQSAMAAYPTKDSVQPFDDEVVEQLQHLCLKHIDLSRDSQQEDALFTFQADTGAFTSTVQTRDKPVVQGVIQPYVENEAVVTVVDAHCDRYRHLGRDERLVHVHGEIMDQLGKQDTLLDISLDRAYQHASDSPELSLRTYVNREDELVMLSFDGLDDPTQEL